MCGRFLARNAALGVAALNGGDRQLQALQDHEAEKNEGLWAFGAVVVFAGIVLFGTYKPRPYVRYVPVLALIGVVGAGCWKPYDARNIRMWIPPRRRF